MGRRPSDAFARHLIGHAVGALALVAATDARAEPFDPEFAVSGFATLGYAATTVEDAEYRVGVMQDGADDDGTLVLDSRLGLQLDVRVDAPVSATLQAIVRERADDGLAPELEWGFVRWLPGPLAAIRVGRMNLPAYAVSDSRAVGYANVMLRPPEDVYTQIPLQRFDGIDATLDTDIGDSLLRVQALLGETRADGYDGFTLDADYLRGVVLEYESGITRLRASHMRADLVVSGDLQDRLADGLRLATPFVPDLENEARAFDGERHPIRFDGLGVSIDEGRWSIDAELTRRRTETWVPDAVSGAITGAWRVGTFTPYLFASRFTEEDGDRRIALPDSPLLAELQAGLDAFYEPRDQRSLGLGLRWDVAPNIALKLQGERISSRTTGVSLYRFADERRPSSGDTVGLIAIGVDAIF